MNTAIKLAIAIGGLLATASVPLTAGAETVVFSGKGAFGFMRGWIREFPTPDYPYVYFYDLRAYQSASHDLNDKTKLSGVEISAEVDRYVGDPFYRYECWNFYDNHIGDIQFKTAGPLPNPNQVIASGVFSVIWTEYCNYPTTYYVEDISFNMDLSALTEEAYSDWGTTHTEDGATKITTNYDGSSAPAAVNASSFISSPHFGIMTQFVESSVGQSKEHKVEINR